MWFCLIAASACSARWHHAVLSRDYVFFYGSGVTVYSLDPHSGGLSRVGSSTTSIDFVHRLGFLYSSGKPLLRTDGLTGALTEISQGFAASLVASESHPTADFSYAHAGSFYALSMDSSNGDHISSKQVNTRIYSGNSPAAIQAQAPYLALIRNGITGVDWFDIAQGDAPVLLGAITESVFILSIAFHPTIDILWAGTNAPDIRAYQRGTDGSLPRVYSVGVSGSNSVTSLAVHPDGRMLVAAANQALFVYSIDLVTHELSLMQTVALSNSTAGLEFNSAGTFLYLCDIATKSVTVYGVDEESHTLGSGRDIFVGQTFSYPLKIVRFLNQLR